MNSLEYIRVVYDTIYVVSESDTTSIGWAMEAIEVSIGSSLDDRRRDLGMTIPQLARRSRVSTATVARVLRGEPTVAVGHVCAVANALGMQIGVRPRVSVNAMLRRAAQAKARRAATLVQATSALEGQGLSRHQFEAMVERTERELQAAGGKMLWAD